LGSDDHRKDVHVSVGVVDEYSGCGNNQRPEVSNFIDVWICNRCSVPKQLCYEQFKAYGDGLLCLVCKHKIQSMKAVDRWNSRKDAVGGEKQTSGQNSGVRPMPRSGTTSRW